jgi:hypothetical protein
MEYIREISEAQANRIWSAFPDAAAYPVDSIPGGRPAGRHRRPTEFFYRPGTVLARTQDEQDVLDILAAPHDDFLVDGVRLVGGERSSEPVTGLVRITLLFQSGQLEEMAGDPGPSSPPTAAQGPVGARAILLFRALDVIEQQLGPGKAAPDHLLSMSQMVTWCNPTEPDPVSADVVPLPRVSESHCDGRGTLVAVADGGLVQDAPARHSWMHGVTGDPDPLSPGQGRGTIRVYGGHGTFIASTVRTMAPQAAVRVACALKKEGAGEEPDAVNAGAAYESDLVPELLAILALAPDVITLSAGTYTWKSGGLISFHVFADGPLRQSAGTVLVAAAGNDHDDRKFSPAEMEAVIGVGALGSPGDTLAWFSNYGDWVKVYAPGEDLVQAFGYGEYTYDEPPYAGQRRQFSGMARWSGTSFSVPLVAGLIAARMSGTGESAREAADSLLRLARAQALPGVGPVLHPGQACLHLCEHRDD